MSPFDGNPENTIEIINIVPQQGPGGIFAPSCEAAISLALEEINSGSGILGRELRVTHIDGGREPNVVAGEVAALVATGMVHAVTGWHTSAVRRAVEQVTGGRVPYLFATDHEGLDHAPDGLFMIGADPKHQIVPALDWLHRSFEATRWAIIGNDYVWPRRTAQAVRAALADPEAIALEMFVPMNTRDFRPFLDDPRLDSADGIIVLLVGADVARFNLQFSRTGRSDQQVRVSPAVDENVLLAAGGGANHNLFVPSGFFVNGPHDRERLDRYHKLHGWFAPTLTNFSNTSYEAIHTLRGMADLAGSLDVRHIRRALADRPIIETPWGEVGFEGNQAIRPTWLARAGGVDFEILDGI